MRYLRGPIVALLSFIIGVVISPIGFSAESMACGRVTDGGGGLSITNYRSTYFVQVSYGYSAYVSKEKASQVFRQRLNEAVRVVDLTPKFNKDSIGLRAVAVFFDAEANEYYAGVFWTDDRYLAAIYSSSYLHVIEFEKRKLHYYSER